MKTTDILRLIRNGESQTLEFKQSFGREALEALCAIIYAVGRVNFLFDKGPKPHLSAFDLCRLMAVSQASVSAKSGPILDLLNSMPLDPRWCLPSKLDDNPLAWRSPSMQDS